MELERIQIESILEKMGFVRSKKNSYCFWKKYPEGVAFINFLEDMSWEKSRYFKDTWSSLHTLEFDCNEKAGYNTSVWLSMIPDDQEFGFKVKDEYDFLKWRLLGSRCEICDIKIFHPIKKYDDFFCSKECVREYEKRDGFDRFVTISNCVICNKPFNFDRPRVYHHTSYRDDKTICVCRSCHARIHFSKDSMVNKIFKPKDKRKLEPKF